MNSNIDNAFVYGARCGLRSKFTDALSFNGTVNYTVGHTIIGEAPLSHIPPLFGRIGLKYSSNKFSLSTYSLFNGEKHESLYGPGTTDNLNEALPDGTPAWWTLNIDASIDLNDNLYVHGGVQNIFPHFSNPDNTDYNKTIFVGRWLEILRPGFERIPKLQNMEQNIQNLEKQAVVVSLENLLGFPFVSEALKSGTLSLHGLWHDIKSGELFCFDQATGNFNNV